MTEQEKLRVMLGHWIEHNREHAADFLRWVDRAGPAAEDLRAAAEGMEEASRSLARALESLGGSLAVDTGPGHAHEHGAGDAGHAHPHGVGDAGHTHPHRAGHDHEHPHTH